MYFINKEKQMLRAGSTQVLVKMLYLMVVLLSTELFRQTGDIEIKYAYTFINLKSIKPLILSGKPNVALI